MRDSAIRIRSVSRRLGGRRAGHAYLALGDAERYATRALKTFDRIGAVHTQAMTRLDIVTALFEPGPRDMERVTGLLQR
jgi:hypothetical protein